MNYLKLFAKQNLNNALRTGRRNFQTFPEYKHLMRKFNDTYPDMKKHLLSKMDPDSVKNTVDQMLTHQLRAGRQIRPAIILKSHEVMTSGSSSDTESEGFQRIHVMAWIVELLHAGIIFSDDVIDKSEMRRGDIPWYKKRGDFAALDLVTLHLCPFILLNDWFGNDVFFSSATKLLTKHTLEGTTCQFMEEETFEWVENNDLNWDKLHYYFKRKALYGIDPAFKLAAFESTKLDLQFDDLIDEILVDTSILIQLWNDYTNVIPLPKDFNFGKIHDEDINAKKLNFSNIYLLKETTKEEKDFILENFGKNDPRVINEIRRLYKKYDVPKAMKTYIDNFSKSIDAKIEKVSNQHRLRDGLQAIHDGIKLYLKSEPVVKNVYPE